MLYRLRPKWKVVEIIQFIRQNDKRKKAFGEWSDYQLAQAILASAHCATLLLSENSQGDLNGICIAEFEDSYRMHVVGIVTSEPGVFTDMLSYWKQQFPGWTLTANRSGKPKIYNFTMHNQALYEICLKKAQEIVANVKAAYPHCEGVMCGGDPPAPTANESTAAMLQAYSEHLPELSRVTAEQLLPFAQAQQHANAVINPQQLALQTQLYQQFGPQLNEIGNQIARQNAVAQAGTDLAVLQGPGNELIKQGLAAQQLVDPEFFRTRALASDKTAELLNSVNLGGLSGGERAEIERSTARDNAARGIEAPTATSTVSNAMNFGNALNNKRAVLANAINTATSFLPASKTGIDPFQVATGRSGTANTGENKFTGTNDVGGAGTQLANNVLGQIGSFQNTAMGINANRRDSLDRFGQVMDSTLGNIKCCFNFFEALDGPLPWFVREERDRYYQSEPDVARGYLWMSRWLVPAMQKSALVKDLVKTLMVLPIVQRGGWLKCVEGYRHGWIFEPHKKFWFAVWRFCGKHFGKKEI